jgi:orotidine-5'-phosphate decarboxylase
VRRQAPVAVALDAPDLDTAARWAALVTPHVSTVKIGLELYLRYGPDVVATVRGASGVEVFLDLKLYDIPATVAGACRVVSRLRPEILTVHASGGPDMVRAAVESAPGCSVAAVTVLTSLGDSDMSAMGVSGPVSDMVLRLSAMAVAAGARGLVCSAHEVAAVRAEVGPDVTLITPGVRPAGADLHDQARVATPEEAIRAGADLLVIGRPITRSPDPGAAAAAVAASLRRVVPGPVAGLGAPPPPHRAQPRPRRLARPPCAHPCRTNSLINTSSCNFHRHIPDISPGEVVTKLQGGHQRLMRETLPTGHRPVGRRGVSAVPFRPKEFRACTEHASIASKSGMQPHSHQETGVPWRKGVRRHESTCENSGIRVCGKRFGG